jgi:ABC-2 type transport system ATP-binding protein
MAPHRIVDVTGLGRTFRVPQKRDGAAGAFAHFFKREYKDVVAVRDVTFHIEAGERVGFLGQNGAGKTTTLKMLSGLLLPTAGSVVVADHDPFKKEPAFLKRIALVMGNKAQLMWDLPAKDSLRLQGSMYGVDDADVAARIDELSALLGLEGLLSQPVRKLSLGERMKAELLSALLHRPDVLFLDEPTLGLDVNAQVAVRAFLRDYNERHGATILLTSHYMADITALCSRVIVIHEGTLLFDGDLKALSARFAPEKRIAIELGEIADAHVVDSAVAAVRADARCTSFRHTKTDGCVVHFAVDPAAVGPALQALLQVCMPKDLSVTDPPIEDIIGQAITGQTGSTPTVETSSETSSGTSPGTSSS